MPHLPGGTVTFLFADLEGSTGLLQSLGGRYADVLARYHHLITDICRSHGGEVVDTQGDGLFLAFPQARVALAAAVEMQRRVAAHPWPEGAALRPRVGLHTGEPMPAQGGYVGMDVHRAARISAAAHGGQIVLSQTTRDLVTDDLPAGVGLRDLGEHRLKDLARGQRLYQVVAEGLPRDFPRLRSLEVLPNNLPVQLTSFIGRDHEIEQITTLLRKTRLLTLTGAGGSGKTRLALQVAAGLLDEYPEGVWWVELAHLTDSERVPQAVAGAMGVPEQRGRDMGDVLVDFISARTVLLILDNCEHLLGACARLAHTLLRASPRVRLLTTSREGLAIEGETLFPVPSLSQPDVRRLPPLERLPLYEAVRLFLDRARALVPAFELAPENAVAVAEVVARLDGIPLAIEMAAARVGAFRGGDCLAIGRSVPPAHGRQPRRPAAPSDPAGRIGLELRSSHRRGACGLPAVVRVRRGIWAGRGAGRVRRAPRAAGQ